MINCRKDCSALIIVSFTYPTVLYTLEIPLFTSDIPYPEASNLFIQTIIMIQATSKNLQQNKNRLSIWKLDSLHTATNDTHGSSTWQYSKDSQH